MQRRVVQGYLAARAAGLLDSSPMISRRRFRQARKRESCGTQWLAYALPCRRFAVASGTSRQGSGSMWIATPSSHRTCADSPAHCKRFCTSSERLGRLRNGGRGHAPSKVETFSNFHYTGFCSERLNCAPGFHGSSTQAKFLQAQRSATV
jgi:hypothetical protein